MIDLITDRNEVLQFWQSHRAELQAMKERSVTLTGAEDTKTTLFWCHKQAEKITCLVDNIRPQPDRNGELFFHLFSESYCVFLFEAIDTAALFKLTFSEFAFDFWNAQRD